MKNEEALRNALNTMSDYLTLSSNDWSQKERDAWIYGIFVGWECDNNVCRQYFWSAHRCDEAMIEMSQKFGWTPEQVAELRLVRSVVHRNQQ